MPEMPAPGEMTEVLSRTIELAEAELGTEVATQLAEVMSAVCLSLTDIDGRYFITFGGSGAIAFTGVPVTRLAKVGGPLIDTLFRCYCEAIGA
jgi:hypothetical protein